jgi:hypothetical protein
MPTAPDGPRELRHAFLSAIIHRQPPMSGALGRGAAAIAVPVVAAAAIVAAIVAGCGAGGAGQAASLRAARPDARCTVSAAGLVAGVPLNATQVDDAHVIYIVSVGMQLPDRAAVIAIATSMQESSLINKPYGTSDSLGLFQQRPSQGWGKPTQIMDPVYASTRFLAALAVVPGWQRLPLTVIAQQVQGSGYPGAYAKWETFADSLVATFNGTAAGCGAGVPLSRQPGARRTSGARSPLPARPSQRA